MWPACWSELVLVCARYWLAAWQINTDSVPTEPGGYGPLRKCPRAAFLLVDSKCIWDDDGKILPAAFYAVLIKHKIQSLCPARMEQLCKMENNQSAPVDVAAIVYKHLYELKYYNRPIFDQEAGTNTKKVRSVCPCKLRVKVCVASTYTSHTCQDGCYFDMRLKVLASGLGADLKWPSELQVGFSLNANKKTELMSQACARTKDLLSETSIGELWRLNIVWYLQAQRYTSL